MLGIMAYASMFNVLPSVKSLCLRERWVEEIAASCIGSESPKLVIEAHWGALVPVVKAVFWVSDLIDRRIFVEAVAGLPIWLNNTKWSHC